MPASVRSPASAAVDTGNITVSKPTGTADGDLLLAVCFADPDGAAVGTPAGWTQVGSTHAPAGRGFGTVYRKAASGEGASYVFPGSSGSSNIVMVLAVTGHDPAAPVDVAATWGDGAASTSHVAPSVSPTGADSLLVCGWYVLSQGLTGTYTPPGDMSERADLQPPGRWIGSSLATRELAASGATGTKTAACTASRQFIGVSVAVKSGGGSTTHAAAGSGASTSGGAAAVTVRSAAAGSAASTSSGSAAVTLTAVASAAGVSSSAGSAAAGLLLPATASGSSTTGGTAAAAVAAGAVTHTAAASGTSTTTGSAAVTLTLAAAGSGISASEGSAAAAVVSGPLTHGASAAGTAASGGTATPRALLTALASAVSTSAGSAFASIVGETVRATSAATVAGSTLSPTVAGGVSAPTVTARAVSFPTVAMLLIAAAAIAAHRTSTSEVTRG